jgi:hypothetical protein
MNMKDFAERLRMLADEKAKDEFMRSCTNELAGRLLTKVRKKTPVGKGEFEPIQTNDGYARYKKGPRKGQIKLKKLRSGGNLRRSWEATPARTEGMTSIAEVKTNVKYAPYVEYGHRQNVGQFVPALGKRLVKPWVNGVHMMRISHDELKKEAPNILSRRVMQYLKGELNG